MAQSGLALIGAGMIAQTQVSALSALQARCKLHAIVSQRPTRAEHLAEYYKGPTPQFTNALSSVLDNPDIQFAIVATPPSVRLDLIQSLSNAGKHILLEKPIARNLDESRQVVEICNQANVTLGIIFQHRLHDTSKIARQIIDSGKLGKIGLVEISAPLWRPQSYYDELERGTYRRDGGGVLITQGIHTIDLALSLTGSVSRVQAMTATTPLHEMEAEDFAVVGLHFSSGAVGSLVASTATYPHGKESITLHGEQGSMHLSTEKLDIHWRDETSDNYLPELDSKGLATPKWEPHKRVIENFIDSIENQTKPIVSGFEALASHELIDAIERSSSQGIPINIG